MSELKFAMAGYGHRGEGMFSIATGFEGVKAAGICEPNNELREKAAANNPGTPVFEDFGEMLDKCRPDAVLVATPADFHADLCIKVLEKDIHVMSEIPCVFDYDEAERLWAAAQKSKGMYMTGANPNMWGFVETAVGLKNKGMLGEIYHMEAQYVHDVRSLFYKTPWRSKFLPVKYCTHSLGPLLRMIDEDLETAVCVSTGSHFEPGKKDRHDSMDALFRTKSGVVVNMMVTFANERPACGHKYVIDGTKGCFERTLGYSGMPARTYFYSSDMSVEKKLIELPSDTVRPEHANNPKAAKGHGGADYALFEKFFNAIRAGGPSPISLREGLRMTLPGIFAAESFEKGGCSVRIRYPWENMKGL